MSRIASDNTLWPLGILMQDGTQSPEQHDQMLDIWNAWFARDERFISLRIYLDESSLDQVPGVGRVTKQWLKAGAAEDMRRLVSCMAITVPPSSFDVMNRQSVEKAFGIPGGVFPNLDGALDWLGETEDLSVEAAAKAHEIVERFRAGR
ncbi:hypothetical protein [Nisaea sp.]|uniref:hypothetical protein n=1 Tax=Nisaea sp. TaxID=2024842 RepID=UPI003266F7E9